MILPKQIFRGSFIGRSGFFFFFFFNVRIEADFVRAVVNQCSAYVLVFNIFFSEKYVSDFQSFFLDKN